MSCFVPVRMDGTSCALLLWAIEEMCYGYSKTTSVLQILAHETGDFLWTREVTGERTARCLRGEEECSMGWKMVKRQDIGSTENVLCSCSKHWIQR